MITISDFLCRKCGKTKLTKEELATDKQICMFCLVDMEREVSKLAGRPVIYVKDAKLFGRTDEELRRWRERLSKNTGEIYADTPAKVDPEHAPQVKEETANEVVKQLDDRTAMEMENLINSYKNVDKPVVLDVFASEDFHLSFRLPGYVPEQIQEIIFQKMQEFYVDTARFVLSSDYYGKYIRAPKDMGPEMQIPFGFGGQ